MFPDHKKLSENKFSVRGDMNSAESFEKGLSEEVEQDDDSSDEEESE